MKDKLQYLISTERHFYDIKNVVYDFVIFVMFVYDKCKIKLYNWKHILKLNILCIL